MFNTKKTTVTALATVVFVFSAVAGTAAWMLLSRPFSVVETQYIYIDADDDLDSVRTKVESCGSPSQMLGFELMAALKHYVSPRTGRYAIAATDRHFDLVRRLANGVQSPVRLTVPEARRVKDVVERIAPKLMIDADELHALLADTAFITALGNYTEETLPCLFVPNTYEVYWNISPENLLIRFHQEKERFWQQSITISERTLTRTEAAAEMDFTPEEVVTLASIVDSETSYVPEKPTVAGLYIHRIDINMPLQSDPTVIFALQDYTIRRVTLAQTRYPSPYNTYIHEGLPPGPIRIPSVSGIDAVLSYEHTNYLYMCAKEDFSGSHNFTADYSLHLQNARRYQEALNRKGIRR